MDIQIPRLNDATAVFSGTALTRAATGFLHGEWPCGLSCKEGHRLSHARIAAHPDKKALPAPIHEIAAFQVTH